MAKKPQRVRIHCESVDEGVMKLIYEDDGVGISNENKMRLFKEGFSRAEVPDLDCS